MKKLIQEFLTVCLLFGGFMFLFYGISLVQAAPVAGGLSETIKYTEDPWTDVGILYSCGTVNVRMEEDENSEIFTTLHQYEGVHCYIRENSRWVKTENNHYIRADLMLTEDEIPSFTEYELYSTFKSYTDYRCLTAVDSPQWGLQQRAYTGEYGIRMVDGRYCVALGSRFTTQIGQKFDIILSDGTVLPCVLSDQKSDRHTDATNTYTLSNGCATEFYVDTTTLYSKARSTGDLSTIWGSPVIGVRVYNDYV